MAVHGCIKQIPYANGEEDEDEEAPIVFKRASTSSGKASSKKPSAVAEAAASLHKREGSSAKKLHGENSESRKSAAAPSLKATNGSSARSSFPGQPKQLNSSAGRMQTSASMSKDDDSDDEQPLSRRLNVSSMASHKNNTTNAHKVVKQSSEHNTLVKPPVKHEASDDSDDEKPLSSKFSVSSATERDDFSNVKKESQYRKPTSPPANKMNKESDDEKPLSSKFSVSSATERDDFSNVKKESQYRKPTSLPPNKMNKESDDSEDEKPLASRFSLKPSASGSAINYGSNEKSLASRMKPNGSVKKEEVNDMRSPEGVRKRPLGETSASKDSTPNKKIKVSESSGHGEVKNLVVKKKEVKVDDNDHVPIAQRMKKTDSSNNKTTNKDALKKMTSSKNIKKTIKKSGFSKSMKVPPGSGDGQKWSTLEHSGVIFPPPYKPHGVKMLYNGQPVDLTPEQEEVATMFAVMKDTEYATKKQFVDNFFNDWRKILGKNHVIKKFELCDFTPIYEWHLNEKEKKKQMTTEEKKALKEEKLKQEEKYMWAIVDGVKEKVGNFRVEPPGLFRGRGEHPKMGKLKRRIKPSDITINIGKGAPVPECPIPGQRWKEVKHDNTVTWLAFWNDPINPKEFKYVFLAASSSLKGQSDKEKYEKARLLKDYIHNIRSNYTRDFTNKDPMKRQIAVATYLIDKLALRAGNEKDDDEADTVGCCTLKVENVELVPPNKLKFDFLGKDSIRYLNTVEVEVPVYKAIGEFQTAKKSGGGRKGKGDDLFDLLDTSKLNAHLKELMPGLTAKVFRTYNASITLDEILNRQTKDGLVPEKIAVYQHANKEVAIICNHQRSVSKSHETQMSKLNEKIDELKVQKEELKVDLSRAKKGKPPLKDAEGKQKRNLSPEALEKKLLQLDAKIEKMEMNKQMKEDLKTVALGTSKINYLDPRISVAWCKRHEVPIEKIFNKSLLAKFAWAMDVDPSFRF